MPHEQRIIHLFPYFGIFLLFECPYSSTFLVIVLFALHTYFDPIMYQVKRGTVFDSFVISALLQFVHFLQRKYSLNSFNLLGHTAPAQAGSLMLAGPFVDYLLTGQRVDHFVFSSLALVWTKSQQCFYHYVHMAIDPSYG